MNIRNDLQIFHEATLEYGGIVQDQSKFAKEFNQRIASFLKIYSNDNVLLKPFPKIIFNCVDNLNFNAFAKKYDNTYIIAFHQAVELILIDLFSRILANPTILPYIGNPKEEIHSPKICDYFTSTKEMVLQAHNGNYKFLMPKNQTRLEYAIHLVTLAMHFIFEHELSHILFGHVDYLQHRFGYSQIHESYPESTFEKARFDLQTLEMDADCTALARSCNIITNAINNPKIVHSGIRKFYTSLYSATNDLFFAIYNTIRLFGDGNFQEIQLGKSTHPNPRVRQLMISRTFRSIYDKWELDYDIEKLEKGLLETFKESENAFEKITGRKSNKEALNPKYLDNHPHHDGVLLNWKENIRPDLINFSFKPLAQ